MALVLLAIAVSLDGMWAGLAQGLRQRRTTPAHLLVVGVESALGSTLAMVAGTAFARCAGNWLATWLAAAVFLGIAGWNFREFVHHRARAREHVPAAVDRDEAVEWSHLLLMGASVAADASLAACALAMSGQRSWLIPVSFGLAHVLLVGLGNCLGRWLAHRRALPASGLPDPPGPAEPVPVPGGREVRGAGVYRLGLRLAPGVIFLILGLARLARGLSH